MSNYNIVRVERLEERLLAHCREIGAALLEGKIGIAMHRMQMCHDDYLRDAMSLEEADDALEEEGKRLYSKRICEHIILTLYIRLSPNLLGLRP